MDTENSNLINVLVRGGVVVMPTDTIYGMTASALDPVVVERVYAIRKRDLHKPFIILIGSVEELEKFSIQLSDEQKNKLKEYWIDHTRPTSVVLDCLDQKFEYLHRGNNSLAFRLPHQKELRDLLLQTGPLIAPSANTEKFPASENIQDAKNYFGSQVDLYIDGGEIISKASKIIKLDRDGNISVLRE